MAEEDESGDDAQRGVALKHKDFLEAAVQVGLQQGLSTLASRKEISLEGDIAPRLDKDKINEYAAEIVGKFRDRKDMDDAEKARQAQYAMADVAYSPRIFDAKGAFLIFGERIEEQSELERVAGGKDKDANFIVAAASAAEYTSRRIAETPGFAERHKEFTASVVYARDSKVFHEAAKARYAHGLASHAEYKIVTQDLKRGISENSEPARVAYIKHANYRIRPARVAASIIGILGSVLLLSAGRSLTGNVIGVSQQTTSLTALLGATMLALSLVTLMLTKKKKTVSLNPSFLN